MRSFNEREKGFEAEFKRDQELMFRITARRNRLFGLCAAARLGLSAGEDAEAYAKAVVAADLEAPGDADVIEKVRTDLDKRGIAVTEAELRAELARCGRSPPAAVCVLKRAAEHHRRAAIAARPAQAERRAWIG